jgi:hypothetical protein
LVGREHVVNSAQAILSRTAVAALSRKTEIGGLVLSVARVHLLFLPFFRVILAHAMLFIGQEPPRVYTHSAIVPSA